MAAKLTESCRPIGGLEALRIGRVDQVIFADDSGFGNFHHQIERVAEKFAHDPDLPSLIAEKKRRRRDDEHEKSLAAYRREELEHMRKNFYDSDTQYHVARHDFVHKVPAPRTPLHLAKHRLRPGSYRRGRMPEWLR